MPRVPSLDTFQVAPTAGPAVAFQSPTMGPGMVAGKQAEELGQGLMRAGAGLTTVAAGMAREANQARLSDAQNRSMTEMLQLTHDKEQGYTHIQGEAALKRPDGKALDAEYVGRLQAKLTAIEQDLGNDAQKQEYRLFKGQLLTQFQGKVQEHISKEFRVFQVSTQTGQEMVGRDMMTLSPYDPQAITQGQGAIKAAVAEKGRLLGWAPEEVTARTVEALSPAHTAVIATALQDGRVDYAKTYMEQVKAELTPDARLRLQESLKTGDMAVQATRTADDIWGRLGPGADRNAPVDVFAMERAAREAFAGDPAKAKATIEELRQRAGAFNASQAEFHAANTTAVYRLLDSGQSINKVRLSPEWQALPGDQQHRIVLSLEQESAARAARGAAEESRALTRLQRQSQLGMLLNPDAYLRYGDPAVLGTMTRPQVEALRPTFGLEGTQHLLKKWDELQTTEGRMGAELNQTVFNHIAQEAGLNPFDPTKTEAQKAELGELKYRIEQRIAARQQDLKRPLSGPERTQEAQRAFDDKVMLSRFLGDKEVPAILASPSDLKDAYVVVGSRHVRLSSIPAADRAEIIAGRRARGLPISEQAIAETYLKKNQGGK